MTENLQSARCSEAEFTAAREAGILVFTTADEVAVHKFAQAIRKQAYADGYAAAIEFIATGDAAITQAQADTGSTT